MENYDCLKKSLFMLFFSLLHRAWQVMSCSDVTCAITCHRCRRRNKEKPISLLEFRQKIDVDFVAIQPFNWKRKLLATYTLRCGIVVYIFLSFVFFALALFLRSKLRLKGGGHVFIIVVRTDSHCYWFSDCCFTACGIFYSYSCAERSWVQPLLL